ncbi:hypothetical protein DFJ58DRAFT_728604 [Suillus subalutaceus]|uniref:uncharacterized protein n=1 Tax=Suillus subalutaceus TaxID=48586 RepID=UPI001B862F76|nr:uncharacterized protein DFJ58DRAFT_728604 [Suillus subalutaceus]KAG1852275.1 hypothetical protein DFJ58DRAFT_728604 [Suillus subalutaceus]
MKDADKSGQPFSDTSASTSGPDTHLPFDSAQQSSLDFSENLTGNWNLDDTFWTDLAAKVAAFEVSGGDNPALPHLPPYPHAESMSSPTPQSPNVPAPLPHIPHTICRTSPATSSHMVPASPEVPVQAAQFLHHDSQPVSPMEPRLQPSPPPISTLPGLPSNTPVITKTTMQPLPHQSNAPSTSGVEPSPDGNEHFHRHRTGQVSIPSKGNAAANSIGENALTVSGKHTTAQEPSTSSHKQKKQKAAESVLESYIAALLAESHILIDPMSSSSSGSSDSSSDNSSGESNDDLMPTTSEVLLGVVGTLYSQRYLVDREPIVNSGENLVALRFSEHMFR